MFLRSAIAILLLLALPLAARAEEAVDYVRQIKPLLHERCYSCHGALKQQSSLRLDTAELVRRGGESGPAVTPGQAEGSLLLARVTATDSSRMPPEGEGAPLKADELALLRTWINGGALGPADEAPEEDPRKHWAFQPVVRPRVPDVAAVAGGNPIDAFIAAELSARGLVATEGAKPSALLRRVYMDLIGLPPTRAELHEFLADASPDAYERAVDRLLASPQYGERWGRHWMDIWRYCDWYGNAGSGSWWNSGCEIWRWRDWIVRSLNQDHGYDRMVMEMLAADEIAPLDDETIVATGYIARNWYALNHNSWKRDMVEHTGKAFLGLTFNCAHCHDHKYDPISQQEYFQFRAFFEPLEMRQDRVAGTPDPGPFKPYGTYQDHFPVTGGMIRVVDAFPDLPTKLYRGGDERDVPADAAPLLAAPPAFLGGAAVQIAPVALPLAAWYPGVKPFIVQEELTKAQQELELAKANLATQSKIQNPKSKMDLALAAAKLASVQARAAADRVRLLGEPGDAAALARAASRAEREVAVQERRVKLTEAEQALRAAFADVDKAEESVTARQIELHTAQAAVAEAIDGLTAESESYTGFSPTYVQTSTGRRTALARWIASRQNPLTPRVAVNHIWLRHFGRPLVESVNNFGRNGQKPSHPQLLDWLAAEFMDSGWSMKHLHRLIVTSRTYCQSSLAGAAAEQNLRIDPDNRYLWRYSPRRLEAETIRDTLLHLSGALDTSLGGPDLPVKDEPTTPRRSLYFNVRPLGFANVKLLEMFDPPSPTECYRRSESLLPQQALALTNSPLSIGQSRRLAQRLEREAASAASLSQSASTVADVLPGDLDRRFIAAAYETILSRLPSDAEQAAALDFLRQQIALYQAGDLSQRVGPTPDGTPPPATEPAPRSRESLVRVLLNHHEFVTVE